jgi:hypothetical protein
MSLREKINIAKDVAQGKAELSSMLLTIKESFDKIQEFCEDTQKNQFEMNERLIKIEKQLERLK